MSKPIPPYDEYLESGEAYLITWLDAAFSWEHPGEFHGAICKTVGWFHSRDEVGTPLFTMEAPETWDEGDDCRIFMAIPEGMILRTDQISVGGDVPSFGTPD